MEERTEPRGSEHFQDARVLVCEDDPLISAELEHELSALGLSVLGPFTSGEEALKSITPETKPDLALLDIGLAGKLTGDQVAKQLWEKEHIPSVFLTSHSDMPTLARVSQGPQFQLLTKPATRTQLSGTVRLALLQNYRRANAEPGGGGAEEVKDVLGCVVHHFSNLLLPLELMSSASGLPALPAESLQKASKDGLKEARQFLTRLRWATGAFESSSRVFRASDLWDSVVKISRESQGYPLYTGGNSRLNRTMLQGNELALQSALLSALMVVAEYFNERLAFITFSTSLRSADEGDADRRDSIDFIIEGRGEASKDAEPLLISDQTGTSRGFGLLLTQGVLEMHGGQVLHQFDSNYACLRLSLRVYNGKSKTDERLTGKVLTPVFPSTVQRRADPQH